MTKYDVVDILKRRFKVQNSSVKEFLAEFLGTFILIIFGDGAVAQSVLTGQVMNDFFSVVWGYSLGVFLGVTVCIGVSGAHINPAVTLAMAIWGRLPWNKVPFYMIAQYLGSFAASVILYFEYSDALSMFESNKSLATAGIFATYPGLIMDSNGVEKEFISSINGFGDQVLGTALLLIAICAVTDKKNINVPKWLVPLFVAFTVMNIGLSFGFSTGFAINPARDLSPRLFTLIAGWGDIPFSTATVDEIAWWWVPIVAPHLGAVLGMFIYAIFIEMHHEEDNALSLQKIDENSDFDGRKGVWLVSSAHKDSSSLQPDRVTSKHDLSGNGF